MRALSIADRERASVDSAVEAVEQKRLEPLEAVEEVVRSPGSARSERTIALPAVFDAAKRTRANGPRGRHMDGFGGSVRVAISE